MRRSESRLSESPTPHKSPSRLHLWPAEQCADIPWNVSFRREDRDSEQVDAVWPAAESPDMCVATDAALTRVVNVFGAARPHRAHWLTAASTLSHSLGDIAVWARNARDSAASLP